MGRVVPPIFSVSRACQSIAQMDLLFRALLQISGVLCFSAGPKFCIFLNGLMAEAHEATLGPVSRSLPVTVQQSMYAHASWK